MQESYRTLCVDTLATTLKQSAIPFSWDISTSQSEPYPWHFLLVPYSNAKNSILGWLFVLRSPMLPFGEDGTILLLQQRKLEKRIFASVQSCFQAIHTEVSHKVKEATLRLFKFPKGKLLANSSSIQITILSGIFLLRNPFCRL